MDLSGHEGEMPIPMTSTYGGGHGQSLGQSNIHDSSPVHHPNGPPPPPVPTTTTEDHHHHHHHQQQQQQQQSIVPYSSKKGAVVRYRECLKNHAASIGGSATDGCGEFMPSGEEGSLEALKCSACSCHRNFHRKETEGEPSAASWECYHHPLKVRKLVSPAGALISGPEAFGYIPRPPPPPHPHHPHHPMIMPLGALQASESDEIEGVQGGVAARPPPVKKRFRTKFTAEQKERMLGFAEMVGWRLQKQEEGVVQQFCQEIGVRRRVLKVWMHNNKHTLARKNKLEPPA